MMTDFTNRAITLGELARSHDSAFCSWLQQEFGVWPVLADQSFGSGFFFINDGVQQFLQRVQFDFHNLCSSLLLGSLFRAEIGYFPAWQQKKNPQKPVFREDQKKGGDNCRRQENLQECRNHEHENVQLRIFHGTLGQKNVLVFSFQSRVGEAKLMENTNPSFPLRYQTLFYR